VNKNVLIIILCVSLAVNLMVVSAISVFFFTRHAKPPIEGPVAPWALEGRDWHKSHLRRRLNLTDEQVATLNKGQAEIQEKAKLINVELMKKRRELIELLKDPDTDSAQADFIFQEIVTLQTQLETMVFHNMSRMKDILTPEQRIELLRLVEKRHPPLFHGPPSKRQ